MFEKAVGTEYFSDTDFTLHSIGRNFRIQPSATGFHVVYRFNRFYLYFHC